jgi:hypothetical protein
MNDQSTKPQVPASLALRVIAEMHPQEHALLAREINIYLEAIRTRAGRTAITAGEVATLFWRMYDVAKIVPNIPEHPVDLDGLENQIKEAKPTSLVKRRLD